MRQKCTILSAGFAAVIIAALIMTFCGSSASAQTGGSGGGQYPWHDCCDYGDCYSGASNHAAEQNIPNGGCAQTSGDDYWCIHDYGPLSWVAIDTDTYNNAACFSEGFGNSVACGYILCPNGSGGWSSRGVSIRSCPGNIQADKTGITCYGDNNGDGIFGSGDSLFQRSGC